MTYSNSAVCRVPPRLANASSSANVAPPPSQTVMKMLTRRAGAIYREREEGKWPSMTFAIRRPPSAALRGATPTHTKLYNIILACCCCCCFSLFVFLLFCVTPLARQQGCACVGDHSRRPASFLLFPLFDPGTTWRASPYRRRTFSLLLPLIE